MDKKVSVDNSKFQEQYWSKRYDEDKTGWDIGSPSTPLISYFDQLEDKHLRILIPGAGNSYEAEYLFKAGFSDVNVIDIAKTPLERLKSRSPDFPNKGIIHGNFFELQKTYDLIIEQTFFCSFPPTAENRKRYAKKMHELLNEGGKLVGLWFDVPLKGDLEKRPFGGDVEEYLNYFSPYFDIQIFEKCYNSIPPRAGSELFGILKKKCL